MKVNFIKVYLKISQEQRVERKRVMNFVKRIKKEEKMRKNNSLILPTS